MVTQNPIFINPFSSKQSFEEKLFFWLRFGVLGCFVGHGFWGIVTKKGWVPFFKVFFINEATAFDFMPFVGGLDILIGLVGFFYPNRAVLLWASFWTLFTAMLRPSAGMGMSEFFERAGNFGVPVLFLLLYGTPRISERKLWLEKLTPLTQITVQQTYLIEWVMRLSLFSLLTGHGGLGFFMKHPVLFKNLTGLGLSMSDTGLQMFGILEIILGFLVLFKPRIPGILLFICFYKLAFEMLFPIAGRPIDIFETIERMGDYVVPIILWEYYRSAYFKKSNYRLRVSDMQKI
ncbi:hypothetical protein [Runella sp.]|uniref:hypothetical protein n=1 Tax=Runella sp. TaxID=1960881 RepID=UPI003D0FA53E